MKKVITVLILTTLIISILCSCTVKVGYLERNNKNKSVVSYKSFTGTNKRSIYLEKGESVTISYESIVEDGDLEILLKDSDRNILNTLEEDTKGVYKLTAEKSGKHYIVIIGEKAKGSYEFSWEK